MNKLARLMTEDHQCFRGAFNALGQYFEQTFEYIKDKDLKELGSDTSFKIESYQEFISYMLGVMKSIDVSVQEEG